MKAHRILSLLVLWILPLSVQGQVYQTLLYSYDSTGNRTRRDSTDYLPQMDKRGIRESDTALLKVSPFPGSLTKDAVLPEEFAAYEKWRQETDSRRTHALQARAVRSVSDTTTYAFGEIPLREGVTPSGGRTYSISIPTATGFKFVPSVAIGYNSQAADGWAGYGWDIQGISSITLINKNKYYHGEDKGANVYSINPVFALDGLPLVTNTQSETSSLYPLVTARGNILVRPLDDGPAGWIWGFDALYPNGTRVRYGIQSDESHLFPYYPVTEMTDLEGNKITFSYSDTYQDGNYRLDAIRYGYDSNDQFDGEVTLTYTTEASPVVRYFAGMRRIRRYRLTGVLSKNGSETICRYAFSYKSADNVHLLEQVGCTNDSTVLRPVRFTYEYDYEDEEYHPLPPDSKLSRGDVILLDNAFSQDDGNYVYRRGKFLSNNYNDGLLVHPLCSEYDALVRHWVPFQYSYEFGSAYSSTQQILFYPILETGASGNTSITTGSGFQAIETVDVDGDGLDELVKVNFNGTSGNSTNLLITVYKCNASGVPVQDDQFQVQINGTVTDGNYKSPSYRTYRWGDFLGNGKVQLLTAAFDKNINSTDPNHVCSQTSDFALIDISSHTKVCDSVLFTLPRNMGRCLLALDLDNDGQTELCYATNFGLNVYRYHVSQGFVLENTHAGITPSVLSAPTTRPFFITDLNGDGYIDILRAPEVNGGQYWARYAFDGDGFISSSVDLTTRSDGDNFMFMDLNQDGMADLVTVGATGLKINMNKNGEIFGRDEAQTPITLTDTKGIIPCNIVDYLGMSAFIKVDGHLAYAYQYEPLSPKMRHVTSVTDSRKRLSANSYEYFPKHCSHAWNQDTVSVNNAAGYAVRTLPIYVLEEERAYLSDLVNNADLFKDRRYHYFNGVIHNLGLGFCGFSKLRTDDYPGVGLSDYMDQIHDPAKLGVITAVEKRKGSYLGNPYSSVVNTYDNHTTTYGKLNPRLTQTVAADTLTGIHVTTAYVYDGYDFPTSINVSRRIGTGTAKTENTTRTYQHSVNTSKYVLGVLTQEDVLKEGDNDADSTWREVTQITYDTCFRPLMRTFYAGPRPNSRAPGTGLNLPPLGTSLISRTQWQYDSHGNVISEQSAPYDATEFTGSTYTYDSDGRYLLTETDALGHATTYAGYNKFGKPASATDYRGRTKTFAYDDWGNLVRTVYPDSTVSQTARAWGGTGLYTVTETTTGKPERITHYDALDREIKIGNKRFNGQWQWVSKEYDAKGRIKRTSLPYRGSSAAYWNTCHYDRYDRPDTLREASGKLTLWSYSGTSITTVKEGITSTRTTDANGNLIRAVDAGGTITYTLRDDGQPSKMTAPGNVVTNFTYDSYGRRIRIKDPSAGTQTDAYDWYADGSSRYSHTTAGGTVKNHTDKYGRTTLVERPEYNTTYTYDSYGRLSSEQSTNNTGVTYAYDSLDRLSQTVETAPDGKWLKKVYSYGTGSNVASILYISQADTVTTENYAYANGHLTGVTLTDGTVVWSLTSENDLGKPTRITSGTIDREYGYSAFGLPTYRYMNGSILQEFSYSFDPITGNLLWRQDEIHFKSETFTYDSLNRLIGVNNNGVYYYGSDGNPLYSNDVGFFYFDDTAHPYRATALEVEHPDMARGRSQQVSYTSFSRPSVLTEGGRSATFTYNADHDRVKMQVADSTGTILSRYYIGGRYELDIAGSSTKERLYLGGDAYSAPMVYIRTGGSGGWTAYNIGRDYLGSITHIATADGIPVAEYSYDPWGRLRNPATLAVYTVGNEPDLFLGRGYTGHEHLPWFGLINMNARLYDPLLHRFLSPDPYVQAPDFTQSLNRYSYALNNPLKYTDESGEIFTWSVSPSGFSFGINFTIFGIPLGFGINVGWGDGLSLGVYGEVGFRIANAGVYVSCSYDYNLVNQVGGWSFSAGASLSAGPLSANVSVSYSQGNWGWNISAGIRGTCGLSRGEGFSVSYGSMGWSVGMNGFYNSKSTYAFQRGCRELGVDEESSLSATDEILKMSQKAWYPDAPMDRIKEFTVEKVPREKQLVLKENGAMAVTIPTYLKGIVTGNCYVYFSPKAFSSAKQLYITMGHEFVHVSNYLTAARMGFSKADVKSLAFLEMTEYWAYKYQKQYTGSSMDATNWPLIQSAYGSAYLKFGYEQMDWYKTRKAPF